jgi:hypothetical protein
MSTRKSKAPSARRAARAIDPATGHTRPGWIQIRIRRETSQRLKSLGLYGDSQDGIINRVLDDRVRRTEKAESGS